MRPIGTSLASAACASADIPSRASAGPTCQTFGRQAATSRSSKFLAAGWSGIVSLPSHAGALQHFAHGVDQSVFRNCELRRPALAPFLVRRDRRGGPLAFDEILDLHLAPVLLLGSLDDDAGRAALVGIFELRSHLAGAEIELSADTGGAQRVDHALVVGDALLVA